MERVLVEPIRCRPHLFYSRRFIIDLRFMADQLRMERMRCGQTFFQRSHDAFQKAVNTPELLKVHVYSSIR